VPRQERVLLLQCQNRTSSPSSFLIHLFLIHPKPHTHISHRVSPVSRTTVFFSSWCHPVASLPSLDPPILIPPFTTNPFSRSCWRAASTRGSRALPWGEGPNRSKPQFPSGSLNRTSLQRREEPPESVHLPCCMTAWSSTFRPGFKTRISLVLPGLWNRPCGMGRAARELH